MRFIANLFWVIIIIVCIIVTAGLIIGIVTPDEYLIAGSLAGLFTLVIICGPIAILFNIRDTLDEMLKELKKNKSSVTKNTKAKPRRITTK